MIWLGILVLIGFAATAVAIHSVVSVELEERSQRRSKGVLPPGERSIASQLEQLMYVSQAAAWLSKEINAKLVNDFESFISAEDQTDLFNYEEDRAFQESVTAAPGPVNRVEAFLRASSK